MVSWQTAAPPSASLPLEPAGDLLRRPAVPEPADHVLPQAVVHGQLPASLPASARQVLGVQREVAAEPSVAVAEAVAAQLAVDGRRVAAEPLGDLADRGAGLDQAEEGASFIEVELAVGPGQRRLRGQTPAKVGDSHFAIEPTPRHGQLGEPGLRATGRVGPVMESTDADRERVDSIMPSRPRTPPDTTRKASAPATPREDTRCSFSFIQDRRSRSVPSAPSVGCAARFTQPPLTASGTSEQTVRSRWFVPATCGRSRRGIDVPALPRR